MQSGDSRRAMSARALLGVLAVAAASALSPVAGAQAKPATAPPAHKESGLPSARSVIDRHIAAIGGRRAILSHTSSFASGDVTIGGTGMTGTFEIFGATPNRSLTRIKLGGIGEVVEGFDGKIGWMLSPMSGPSLTDGKQLDEKRFDSDFYNDLHDPTRYASMKTVEKAGFNGVACYKLVLTRKDGGEDEEYYDVATGLRVGAAGSRTTEMGTISATQVLSDYRKFGNLLQATTMKQSAMGVEQVFKVTRVEYDRVDPAVFEPPAAIKALIR